MINNAEEKLIRSFSEYTILYTLWTEPLIKDDLLRKLFPLFVLSILSYKRFYKRVCVVTDSAGKKLLDKIDLDIEIHTDLDGFNFNYRLWSAPKYVTYKKFFGEKFIHVDCDTVIEKPFYINKPILVQSNEGLIYENTNRDQDFVNIMNYYSQQLALMGLGYLVPKERYSLNVGVFHMENMEALDKYIQTGIFVLNHMDKHGIPEGVEANIFMIFAEQQIIKDFVKEEDIQFIHDIHYEASSFTQTTQDVHLSKEFEKQYGIPYEEIFSIFPQNLLNIGSLNYIHYVASVKYNEKIGLLTKFYLEKFYPHESKKVNESNYEF